MSAHHVPISGTAASVDQVDATYSKISWRLLPFLGVLWVLAWLDRVNIGFAKLQMLDDLKFSEAVYGLGAGIFFIGYFLFEVPSNMLLQKIGAKKTVMRITIGWGLICILQAWVTTPTQFYVLRFLVGTMSAIPVFWQMPNMLLSGGAAAVGVALINSVANLAGFGAPYLMGVIKASTGKVAPGLYLVAIVEALAAVLAIAFVARIQRRKNA